MTEHHLDIRQVRIGKYAVVYGGRLLGEFADPLCEGARALLAQLLAEEDDTLVLCRDGKPQMTSSVGWAAGRRIQENERISPRFVRYRPFAADTFGQGRPK